MRKSKAELSWAPSAKAGKCPLCDRESLLTKHTAPGVELVWSCSDVEGCLHAVNSEAVKRQAATVSPVSLLDSTLK